MAPRRIEEEIDRLYQLPLDEFTAARNALARTAGADGADVRQLVKPPIAAWAVNQLYWKHRDVYEALIAASTTLRKIHKTILGGRRADVREAAREHDQALDAALKAALTILEEAGHPATDATRQAVVTTLRALPSNEPPGRLTESLQPGGFEMLQGLSIAGSTGVIRPKATVARLEPDRMPSPKGQRAKPDVSREEAAKAEAARADAAKALREAEQSARREEFEATRATRDAEKAAKQLDKAREALEAAQQTLQEAEAAASEAARQRDAAARRAKETERALEAARRHLDAATSRRDR